MRSVKGNQSLITKEVRRGTPSGTSGGGGGGDHLRPTVLRVEFYLNEGLVKVDRLHEADCSKLLLTGDKKDKMDNILIGLGHIVSGPTSIMLFLAALVGGLLFGALPGINMVALGAIILPFTAYLDATDAIMVYGVLYVSGTYGGAVMAILFNIPGSAENAPTAFDGYPLTKQGKAGKAIGLAVMSSSVGGILGTLLMMVATPVIGRWAIHAFGPPEMIALIFFGLTIAASVGAETIWKGWLSVVLGLTIALIGIDPVGGIRRYSFGSYYLMAGINFIPLILGFFAISELFVQAEKMVLKKYTAPKAGIEFPSLGEFLALKFTMIRSWLIGFLCGLLPGIGGTLAAFFSYNATVRLSKHPERFGKGEMAGVVASETSNNAACNGAMIPLLALGLPGGAVTAMMLTVFMIHGMEPGPLIMVGEPDLVWTLFVAMFFANLMIFFLGYIETRTVVNLLRIPFRILIPFIMVLSTIGGYAFRNSLFDVWVMFLGGICGYFIRRSGYSAAGVVIGVILGDLGESAFAKSMQMFDYNWLSFFGRPVCAVLIVAGILTLFLSFVKPYRELKRCL